MDTHKKCAFIGHRNVYITDELREIVQSVVEDLICKCGVETFLFGSRSNFDALCHAVVTELRGKYRSVKRVCYPCKSEACVLESGKQKLEAAYSRLFGKKVELQAFDEEVEHKAKFTAGRASYVERNQAMIDDCDYCVFYYDENNKPEARKTGRATNACSAPRSGTKLAYEYAVKKKKMIINVATVVGEKGGGEII